jgi:hypothetical protein
MGSKGADSVCGYSRLPAEEVPSHVAGAQQRPTRDREIFAKWDVIDNGNMGERLTLGVVHIAR